MSNKNSSLREIGEKLAEAESILLYPHTQADGDALGSAAAMCRALRNSGKQVYILIEDSIAEFLKFLDNGYSTWDPEQIKEPDICMCVDCGDIDRFTLRKEKFLQGKTTICIDHHVTSQPFADYNYIDGAAAATAEIIFKLLKEMNLAIDKEIGEALFTGICTDTGNFQYSNTSKESHLIVAQLYDAGIDHTKIAVEIYQNVRLEKIRLSNKIMETLELFAGGQGAVAYVTREMIAEAGATMDETEGVVETLRNIRGVEIAAFLKEKDDQLIKVSMRAKNGANVAVISEKFRGGGHTKAAGYSANTTIQEAKAQLKKEIEKSLEK